MTNLTWKYYIFYVIWDVIERIFVFFFFIETKNTPLKEIAKIFDGEDAVVGGGLELTKKELQYHSERDKLGQMMTLDTNRYKFAPSCHIITIILLIKRSLYSI